MKNKSIYVFKIETHRAGLLKLDLIFFGQKPLRLLTKKKSGSIILYIYKYCYSNTSKGLTTRRESSQRSRTNGPGRPRTQVVWCSQYFDQRHYMISVHSTCVSYPRTTKFNNIQRFIFSPFMCKHLISLYEHDIYRRHELG